MGLPEMDRIADLIARALASPEDDAALAAIELDVAELTSRFPLYASRLVPAQV
jgi:glycine/serine hydroxymethyltransferase